MPFLPPNQQHQSTEGIDIDADQYLLSLFENIVGVQFFNHSVDHFMTLIIIYLT